MMAGAPKQAGGFTRRLAHWIATAPRSPSAEAVRAAERAVADTVACLVAGLGEEAPRRVRQGLRGWGQGGGASVAGQAARVDAPWAALANGAAAHALDYDDVLVPAASHVSAVLVPSLLALAEETGAGGMALVDAYIVGVEVQMCLAAAVNMTHYTSGWHTTSTLGAPAAAAACARMLGLDELECAHALSIATSLSGGFKRQFGTAAKPLHAGLAAKSGLQAARLAQAGLTADLMPFEGERGFGDLMADGRGRNFDGISPCAEGVPAVLSPGLLQKCHPCCASAHQAVDGVLSLMAEHGLGAAEITGIHALVPEVYVRNLMYEQPRSVMQARFSMPYCLASAAVDGGLGLAAFSPQALGRPEVGALMERVAMAADPGQPPDMAATAPASTLVTLEARGRRWSRRVVPIPGGPERPLSEAALAAKFQDCVAYAAVRLPDLSYAAWRNISRQASVAELCACLRSAPA